MSVFNLPLSTTINRSIPKNAFDKYTNSKQKRIMVDLVDKIKWTNKIASETINLPANDIKEIQIFEIHLKKKEKIKEILDIIDKSIPYHIVFVLIFNENVLISTSKKHSHVTNEDTAVIDWNFATEWLNLDVVNYQFNLKQSVDFIYSDLCIQLNGSNLEGGNLEVIIAKESQIKSLKYQIAKLETAIKKNKQFNRKVELNIELQDKINCLNILKS